MTRRDAETDRRFMAAALRLGRRELGLTSPNPAVGALVVRFDGGTPRIIGRGATRPPGGLHAERVALEEAGAAARGATLYVSLEPCSHEGRTPACVAAILAAGVARVVTAMEDPNPLVAGRGHAALQKAGVAVETGVLAAEARRLHAGHVRHIVHRLPHVTLKLAVSRDGRIGGPGRSRVAITGPEALAQVHMMRAEADAILVGLGTVLADDPLLTVRLPGLEGRSPVRVVMDRDLATPLTSRLVATAGDAPLWILCGAQAARSRRAALEAGGAAVLAMPDPADALAVRRLLGARGVTRLLVEGGARVAALFHRAGAVDEAVLFSSPKEIGPEGVAAPPDLPDASFALIEERGYGGDRMRRWERA